MTGLRSGKYMSSKQRVYSAYGVDVTVSTIAEIAKNRGVRSDQTIRNWINAYGDSEAAVEAMLTEKLNICSKHDLQKAIDADYVETQFRERQKDELSKMGFSEFEKREEPLPAVPAEEKSAEVKPEKAMPAEEKQAEDTRSIDVTDAIIGWNMDYITGSIVACCVRAAHGDDRNYNLKLAREYINKAIEYITE